MKIKDFIWILIILSITGFVLFPTTQTWFEDATEHHPYLMGFIKTAILATMGERLVVRIKTGNYFSDSGIWLKGLIWGFFGIVFVLIFKIYAAGVQSAQLAGLWPMLTNAQFIGKLFTAFSISLIMNLTFAPTFMLLHRITDTYIHISHGKIKDLFYTRLSDVIKSIDFQSYFGFVLLKTIPLFWIPAHTITFLLPENYRVLMAAYLSIALGILLSVKTNRKDELHETK